MQFDCDESKDDKLIYDLINAEGDIELDSRFDNDKKQRKPQ